MNKLAIVTGGTRGIGAATALILKNAGFFVISNYMSNDNVAQNFHDSSGILIKKWNVGSYEESTYNVDLLVNTYGPVNVLINNAGITNDKMFHKMLPQDWLSVININLISCFNMCHSVIKSMRDNKYGRIINISSVNGQTGQIGQTNYAASKAGIIGFTKSLALESATNNITVNSIAPGYIETSMTSKIPENLKTSIKNSIPMQKFGTAEDIARMVLYLASDQANYITGATFSVNGGYNMI